MAFYIDEQHEDFLIVVGENEAYYLYEESDVVYNHSINFYEDYSTITFNSGSSCSGTDGCVTKLPFLMQVEAV